jgi:hypothetical protein
VVVCAVDETVSCAASEAASDGFFDVNDQSPWDTWLGVVDAGGGSPLLLAWVPTRDVRLVDQGIAVNPVDGIYWLESRGGDVRRPDVLDQFLEARGSWIPRDDGPPAEPRELLRLHECRRRRRGSRSHLGPDF